MDHNRFDVIVVGGGPAGITAAAALGRRGFSVLVCEAAVYAGAENWSGAVYFTENLESDEVFGKRAIEEGPVERPLVERGFYLYNGHSLLGAALRDPQVFRSSYTVLRPVFDRYLAELSREHGVVVANETTVQSLIRHDGRVIGVHTERGPAYADVVFLAEGDASHLVTQEGYERGAAKEKRPHFLQGIKEVVSLPPEIIEERFGLAAGDGGAYEMLLRNGSRKGRTVRLNSGAFIYTNRDSISLGLVLPVDNLAREFDGDHNLLMEWFKNLPEVARWIDGGEVTSYGTKLIRSGGLREIPQLVDDGLAIGGAASAIGIDFPYPNFTGPATAMGLLFARAVERIGGESRGTGGGAGGKSPYTSAALESAYLAPLRATHYYRNVERLADWPGYIERTQYFFERQLDVAVGAAFIMSRPDLSAPRRWWEALRLKRRVIGFKRWGALWRDARASSKALGLGRAGFRGLGVGTLGSWLLNTVTALLPGGNTTIGGDEATGVAQTTTPGGGSFRAVFRVMAGAEPAGRMPWVARWYWRRFGPALAGAFADVYTNDDEPLEDKLPRALGRLIGRLSIWDAVYMLVMLVVWLPLYAVQALGEWLQYKVLGKDPNTFRQQYVTRLLEETRARIRMDDDAVVIRTPYDHKLATIRYQEGEHSHIKVLWPDDLVARNELDKSPLWSVCPAKVYEVQHHPMGMPGVVVSFDNCVKCETCWRATDDVHWSRATNQRLIYETYTPTHQELRDYLMARPQPVPRLRPSPGFWESYWEGVARDGAAPAEANALAAVRAELARFRVALGGYARALADSPLALERGERTWLEELAAAAGRHFDAASALWHGAELSTLRERVGGRAATLWQDAAERVAQISEHARAKRYFWADVVGKQLAEHHVAGLDALFAACGAVLEAVPESATGALDHVSPEAARAWGDAWLVTESNPRRFDAVRAAIAEWCEEHLDSAALRALEEGHPPGAELRGWLARQLADATAEGRDGVVTAGAGIAYGRRDVLLEELTAVDPSLAALAAQHLLACDLLADVGSEQAAAIRRGEAFATVVSQGSISNRPLPSGVAEDAASSAAAQGVELHGEAPLVLTALAHWLLVVRGTRGYLVPCDDRGVRLEEVGSIGLVGAGARRAVFDGCAVPRERTFEIAALPSDDSDRSPAVGDPCADTVALAVADHLAIMRGAGTYLTERARDHAASRVQFPGAFQDEAGRDSIAKFGAVKQMLAVMEAQRVLVESLSVVDPDPGDAAVGAAVRKILAADAFGPGPDSLSYNCGQVFGGTAFSEDDCIAKYYRDASPFRFLIAHDDELRVRVGRRRLRAAAAGEPLVPVRAQESAWIDVLPAEGPLAPVASRWRSACAEIDEWATGAATRLDGGELDDLLAYQAGEMVVRALAVKVCILRSAWRMEAGLPAAATVEATALLADRFGAEAPRQVGEAELLREALRVGAESVVHGDFEPGAAVPDAEPYEAVLASDFAARSGIWLEQPYDGDHPRYIPEILWNDETLRAFRQKVEAEQKLRYVEPRFDGMTYGRWIEKLHRLPDEDLDYLIDRGYFRMPIPQEFGGEGALKAQYYTVCEMTGRFGDAAQSLAIMANTSIGTTPFTIGLYQDLPRARAELERVKHDPSVLGDIEAALDALIRGLERPDFDKLQAGYLELAGVVKKTIAKSAVLKYIGAGFLRAFFGAGKAGQRKDMDGFGAKLVQARGLLDEILTGVEDRLADYPRRQRAHELALKMISAGYTSAFALTEPTAGSDSGGVKTTARPDRRRVHRDEDGVLYFFLDEENRAERRNLLDADRLEFDYDGKRLLYRWADDAPPSEIRHDGYDYEKDRAGHWRTYMHGDREVAFTDIAEIRDDGEGGSWYEFWELNGAKMWITNGRFAHLFALYALTDPEGVTGFIVDRHAEGLVVGSDEEKLGQRGSPTNELSITGVRVPRECVIGFRGRGQVNALETLNTGRTGLAVSTRATMQEMMDDAVDYLAGAGAERGPYPRQSTPPTALQKYWVGRLMEELVCTAAVAHELIGLFDHPLTKDVRMESAIGKYWNSEAEHEGIELMERLRGLDGLTHRHRIEKTRRDARVLNIYEGTNEVQRYLLLRDLVQRILPAWRAADGSAGPARVGDGPCPELRNRLEVAKHALLTRLDQADVALGPLVWANVNLQPCFFRLAEIAGLIKVMDALLYRLEWIAAHDVPDDYGGRLQRASRLAFERCLLEIAALDRRFAAAYAYVQDGRYPPEAQLGFLSLDEHGAATERFGTAPDGLVAAPRQEPLARPVRIAVLAKPVPVAAPRPRFGADSFAESLYAIDAVDARSLDLALRLKRRDPERVRVAVYSIAGSIGAEVLQDALAAGADDVTLVEAPDDAEVLHDPAAVARTMARALAAAPADLVLCGAVASDTGQGAVAPLLAGLLGRDHIERALDLHWCDDAEPGLRVTAVGWQGHELDVSPPAVIAVEPPGGQVAPRYRLGAWVAATGSAVPRVDAAELGSIDAMPVWHGARVLAARDGDARIATTPEEAAEVLLDIAGGGAGAGAEVTPWQGEPRGFGQQPEAADPTCLFVCAPVTGNESEAADLEALGSAARFARGNKLPLDVVLPLTDADTLPPAAGRVIAEAAPRRIYVIAHPQLGRYGWKGHLEWLQELWGMYRGEVEWLLGGPAMNTLFARLAGQGPPGVDRCWPWLHVQSVTDGTGRPLRLGAAILDGAGQAMASPPLQRGVRIVTFAPSAEIDLGSPPPAAATATEVYLYEPRLDYDVASDPVAALLARLGGGELTLGSAELIVDVGYGAGARDDIDTLANPLLELLTDELGLTRAMIGATRKVTQDLETLPMELQIGQTGVRVDPKLVVALGVSGAPQHLDWIGDAAVILSFNTDPDAPLMKLNEQRPRPLVHPIVGDVHDTIPRFIAALRSKISSRERVQGR